MFQVASKISSDSIGRALALRRARRRNGPGVGSFDWQGPGPTPGAGHAPVSDASPAKLALDQPLKRQSAALASPESAEFELLGGIPRLSRWDERTWSASTACWSPRELSDRHSRSPLSLTDAVAHPAAVASTSSGAPSPGQINARVARSSSISYPANSGGPIDYSLISSSPPARRRKGSNVTSADVARATGGGAGLRRRPSQSRARSRGLRACAYPLFLLLSIAALVYLGKLVSSWTRVKPEPIRFPSHAYTPQHYHHLDMHAPVKLRPSSRIFHVTKEFGPATMGGLGAMLTALAVAQADSPYLHISVVMPHYSYLDAQFGDAIKHVVTLGVPISDPSANGPRKSKTVACEISKLKWTYEADGDFLSPALEVESDHPPKRTIGIFLIGPGDKYPFHVAFKAKDAGDVYTAYKPLKQEWKDLWFAKAAAEFLAHTSTVHDDTSVFEIDSDEDDDEARKNGVDVVHLHGATNAMVAYYLRQFEQVELLGNRPPSIVYTLHDSLDEVEYSNLIENQLTFLPGLGSSKLKRLESYTYGNQVFTSALGIDHADMVTFVSRTIATDIVEGRFKFPLSDLVMPSIGARAKAGSFVGVTNGLDFTEPSKNPFTSPQLIEHGLAFPRVGRDLSDFRTFYTHSGTAVGARTEAASFLMTKQRAKEYLLNAMPRKFQRADMDRPWFLFIGRFQYNKGCEFFEPLLEAISSAEANDARLIVLGARNNYPISALRLLERHYPDHFTLIDDKTDLQAKYGTFFRMASDFAFVPSFSEAFGLVAAEGMLFGMTVVSSGVGGLAEFLVPLSEDSKRGNAHLFQIFPPPKKLKHPKAHPLNETESAGWSIDEERTRPGEKELAPAKERLTSAVLEAVAGWRFRMDDRETAWSERELFVRRLVASALELGWSRPGGPIDEYLHVYDRAITNRRHTRSSSTSALSARLAAPPHHNSHAHSNSHSHPAAHPAPAAPPHVAQAHDALRARASPDESILFIPVPEHSDSHPGKHSHGHKSHDLPLYKVWSIDETALKEELKQVEKHGGAEAVAAARQKLFNAQAQAADEGNWL